ncbi:MAG: peroxiredoxin [Gammaproteobacteria bacterium]|nr:peroxiredoxin [Gammaproteobacteria bacterium]RZP03305.1 MAG: peroxiredoxin [Gammaproteobacteria bacterium]|tara:strand:+ start:360 stop:842 length:483 start_codon:yes stop_codon:yes gene_type:complete
MTIQVGDTLPSINLTTMTDEGPKPVSMAEISSGKKVVLFAVPGAFTPTCSVQHLPGFLEKNSDLKEKGVDVIACVSVNDPFVMKAWGEDRSVGDDVMMLSDGNGEFTAAIGLEMDGSGFGLGTRSQRYAMIIDDGVVSALNVEPGPGLDVSSAETILGLL